MQKFLLTLFAVLSIAVAADLEIVNQYIEFGAQQAVNSFLQIKDDSSSTLSSVSFTITPEDSNVLISYPNSGSDSVVGSIQHGASGYGNFYVIGNAGIWNSSVYVTYTKGSTVHHSTQWVVFDIASDDDEGGEGKREIEMESTENAADNSESKRSDIGARTADISCLNIGWNIYDSTPTWVGFYSKAGSNALSSVTFTVTPDSPSVIVVYPSGSGNSLGSFSANQERDTSIQLDGPSGTFNMNVTYKYKYSGGSTYHYLTNNVTLIISDPNGGDGAGRREFIANDNEIVAEKSQPAQYFYVAAAAAGVAVVAVVAIVGTILYRRRSTETTTSV